jgi:hypothetical protein
VQYGFVLDAKQGYKNHCLVVFWSHNGLLAGVKKPASFVGCRLWVLGPACAVLEGVEPAERHSRSSA